MEVDISVWIGHWGDWTPSKPALRFEDHHVTYAELESKVGRFGGFLRSQRVGPGDRVAYLGPNCPQLLEVLFACSRVGACFVPLNARLPASELSVFVGQARPRLVVVSDDLKEIALAACPADDAFILEFTPGSSLAAPMRVQPATAEDTQEIAPDDPALILFTSGTTGVPKGAVITNGGLQASVASTVATLRMTSEDRVLTFLPMFHLAALTLLTLPALSVGAEVTVHRQFDATKVLEEIDRSSPSLLLAPPSISLALSSHPLWIETDLTSLRCVMTGGTTIGRRTVEVWSARGVSIVQGYGLTETGGNATATPLDDAPAKSLTAGKPTMGFQVRVVGTDGCTVSRTDPGEILVRGPSMMSEYFDNPDASREVMPDGWLRTGDIGAFDEDGYLHVLDRLKEVIIVGVSNVYPADLEAMLEGAPEIAAAAVVGVPDSEEGEVPIAFVVPAEGHVLGAKDVLDLFEGKVATYKQPRKVVILDALPLTPVGKVERTALRAAAIAATQFVLD